MPIAFRRTRIDFSPRTGSQAIESNTVIFDTPLNSTPNVALAGFDIGYTSEDHHVFRVQIRPFANWSGGNVVVIGCVFLFRDSSGNIDDPYSGLVDVLVIADVQ